MSRLVTLLGKLLKAKRKDIPVSVNKILIIRSGGLGDVLMTTPLISAIKRKYKKAKISYLVGKWSSIVLKNNPNINEILEFDDTLVFKKNVKELAKLIKKIRGMRFNMCFILDKSYHWGLFAYLAGIPFRIAFDRKGEGFPNNLSVNFNGSKYELEYYMDIAELIGIKHATREMQLFTVDKDKRKANAFFKKNNLENKVIIGIVAGGAENPGQTMYEKRWPIDKYIGLVNVLEGNSKVIVLLFGGKNDANVNKQIKDNCINKNHVLDVSNYGLHEAFELMKKCNLFITHDSGAMHLAGAAKVKLIALFGPTDPKRFAPKKALVIKSPVAGCPCYNIYGNYDKNIAITCMPAISVDSVYQLVKKVIKKV